MNKETQHVQVVQDIYAAFGRGDVPFILQRLSSEVEWDYGHAESGIPWLTPRRGPDGAAAFFEALAGFQIQKFDVRAVMAQGPLVLCLIDLDGVVQRTGRRVRDPGEVHIWHFDDQGKVSRFRHAADTLQHWRALQP